MRHTVLNGIHIHCPEALLVSNYTTIEVLRGREREEIFPPPGPGETPPGWATLGEINHFLDCIECGQTPLTDGREGLKSLQTIWQLYEQSGWDGR
jgi:predicted dehydrogenase